LILRSIVLIGCLPIGSSYVNIFSIDSSKLYSHAKETVFLFLIVCCEGILMKNDGRYIKSILASPGKIRELRFDSRDEGNFSLRKISVICV
jgi:hypothetical protein